MSQKAELSGQADSEGNLGGSSTNFDCGHGLAEVRGHVVAHWQRRSVEVRAKVCGTKRTKAARGGRAGVWGKRRDLRPCQDMGQDSAAVGESAPFALNLTGALSIVGSLRRADPA